MNHRSHLLHPTVTLAKTGQFKTWKAFLAYSTPEMNSFQHVREISLNTESGQDILLFRFGCALSTFTLPLTSVLNRREAQQILSLEKLTICSDFSITRFERKTYWSLSKRSRGLPSTIWRLLTDQIHLKDPQIPQAVSHRKVKDHFQPGAILLGGFKVSATRLTPEQRLLEP